MTSFKRWRQHLGLKQKEAAAALGVSPRQAFDYDHGHKELPRCIRLAMAAIALGLKDYEGPPA